jgi:hypothetical protein
MDKQDQPRQVIHLQIIATDEHHYYGSLSAMYEHFTRNQVGVAIQTLYNQFKGDMYQNDLVVIRKGRLIQKKNRKMDDLTDQNIL